MKKSLQKIKCGVKEGMTTKHIPIHPALVLLAALLACGLMESLPAANQKIRGRAIQNVSKGAMPVARMQKVGNTGRKIYTSRAKAGYCFAVKNGKILYMSTQRAIKLEAQTYAWANHAQSASRTPQPQPKKL